MIDPWPFDPPWSMDSPERLEVMGREIAAAEGDLVLCDRCGDLWRVAEVRSYLPCCPVPLCDLCARQHLQELQSDVADGIITTPLGPEDTGTRGA